METGQFDGSGTDGAAGARDEAQALRRGASRDLGEPQQPRLHPRKPAALRRGRGRLPRLALDQPQAARRQPPVGRRHAAEHRVRRFRPRRRSWRDQDGARVAGDEPQGAGPRASGRGRARLEPRLHADRGGRIRRGRAVARRGHRDPAQGAGREATRRRHLAGAQGAAQAADAARTSRPTRWPRSPASSRPRACRRAAGRSRSRSTSRAPH